MKRDRAYRVHATFVDEAAAHPLFEAICRANAYSCEMARVADVTVFPGGFVERLDDGRLAMGWKRPTVSYVVRAW